jgi:hypothetical protein
VFWKKEKGEECDKKYIDERNREREKKDPIVDHIVYVFVCVCVKKEKTEEEKGDILPSIIFDCLF